MNRARSIKLSALLIVLLIAWMPMATFALGLGPITMRSALNQPLDAEIEIHSAEPGDLDGLAVRLASSEDFSRVNIERGRFLTRINFKVVVRSDGTPYIKLSTSQPVTEPYLDFLIEARWARGRALKEYTVLVDPPVLTAETPAPVQQAQTAPVFAEPVKRQQPVRSSRPAPKRKVVKKRQAAAPAVRAPSSSSRLSGVDAGGNSYRVQRNDTLSEIAERIRADESVSVNQMMMALLKANPRAFYNNNINQLKAGVVLRMEDHSQATEMSRSTANSAVREQMSAWREGRPTRLVAQVDGDEAGEGGSSSASFADEPESSVSEDARLKLVAPGKEGLGSGSAGEDSAEATRLQQELILATEALDANRAETDDLKARLSDLEEQLGSMQRLINLKDEEMASLQKGLKEQQSGVVDTEPKAEKAKPQPVVPEAEDSIVDSFMSDTTLLGIAAIFVLGVVAWLVVRRRKMQEGFQESILNVGMADSAASVDSFQSGDNSSAMVSDFAMSGMEPIQTDAADVDPISEADVYLAYGRHQQAEDIIKQAITSSPDRLELHAKLLEVLHAASNRAGFEEHAQILHEKLGGDESNELWVKAATLGAQIAPNNPLFGGVGGTVDIDDDFMGQVSDVTDDEDDLLDFDFDEDESFDLDGAGTDTASAKSSDDDLDFDVSALDFDLDDDTADDAISNIDSMDESDDNSLDFDMSDSGGLDFETSDQAEEPVSDVSEELVSLDDEDHIDLDTLDLETSDDQEQDFSAELSLDEPENEADFDVDLDLDLDDESDDTVVAFDNSGSSDESDSEDIFADVDEIGTKLDLAKAYVDMGDSDGARSILDEVLEEGDDTQKQQAENLLQQMG